MTHTEPEQNPLTWALLLAKWTEFAQAAVALPTDGDAGRHRRSVTPLISLSAITHALGDLGHLEPDERALALDRAEIQIRADIETLDGIWANCDPPESAWVFVEEAAMALAAASEDGGAEAGGFAWMVVEDGVEFVHPGELLAALATVSPTLEVWVPSPGVPFFAGSIACFVGDVSGVDEAVLGLLHAYLGDEVEGPVPVDQRCQTVRQFDFARGGPVRDVVVHAGTDVPGQPLLVAGVLPAPGAESAEIGPVPMPPRMSAPMEPLPVEVLDAVADAED